MAGSTPRRSSRLTPSKGKSPRAASPPAAARKSSAAPAPPPPPAAARARTTTRPVAGGGRHAEYEFCGPVLGPLALIVGLPAVCYALVGVCNAERGCVGGLGDLASRLAAGSPAAFPGLPRPLFTWPAFWAVPAWFAFQAGLHLLLPGPTVLGAPLRDGRRLPYKLTGLANLGVTLALVAAFGFSPSTVSGGPWWRAASSPIFGRAGFGAASPPRLAWAYDNFVPLLTAACAWSTILAACLYAASFRGRAGPSGAKPMLALGGDTPSHIYNFFMGRELNPRCGGGGGGGGGRGRGPWSSSALSRFDWKEFCELYPGLIGWVLLDLACAAKAVARTGTIPRPLAMVIAFHTLYVADALAHERAILTTMDITTDGFGFMLAFGDLAWVPFVYTLPARFAADFPAALPSWAAASIYALFAAGYAIFRGSNSQKDAFRTDPSSPAVAHLKTLTTASGRRLLVSGWWGVARHINYFGDWLLSLAWCLPCGTGSCVPYFYAAYFGILLIHRDRRDGEACARKYGADWDRYCALVPWRIVPFVY